MINYYGGKDEVVPTYIACLAEGFHKQYGGGDTRAENVSDNADHRGTYIYSVIRAEQWYKTFLNKK